VKHPEFGLRGDFGGKPDKWPQHKLRVQFGTAQRVDMAEATLRLQELETEMAKAELDLALARRELQQRRSSR